MAVEPIVPPGSPPPMAPYSPGTRAGNTVYVAGTVAMAPDGKTIGVGDASEQTRAVLETMKRVIETAGGTLGDVAFVHIFLKDLADYAAMNAVYRSYFPDRPPARYCIRAELVKPEFLVEMAAIAHLGP